MRGDMDSAEFIHKDTAVIVEIPTMMDLSKRCNGYLSKRTSMHACERSTRDSLKIPSYIEQISITMTTTLITDSKKNMRMNPVTCVCIYNCVSIFEFIERVTFSKMNGSTFSHIGSLTIMHVAVATMMFKMIFTYYGLDKVVKLFMLANKDAFTAISVHTGRKKSGTVVKGAERDQLPVLGYVQEW